MIFTKKKDNMASRPESGKSGKSGKSNKSKTGGLSEAQQRANEKLKLPENKKPSVLDRNTIWNAIKPDDYADDETDKAFVIKTQRTLRLEFRQILKIDNLQELTSLTRLFLDNNFLEQITGLDALVNLVWLDLSFNKIRKVEGLEKLEQLQVLALYQNDIENLENLEHLTMLSVLRVGNNKLSDRKDILYLRKLKSLRTLSIKGNPFCFTEEWRNFTVALLPNLSYLEISSISLEEREKAISKFQVSTVPQIQRVLFELAKVPILTNF